MADASVNAEANALNAEVNGGKLQIYDGAQPVLTPQRIAAILSRLSFIVPKTEILLPEIKPLDEALVELRRIIENVKNMPPLTPVSVRSPEEIALELLKARIKQEDQQILELILTEVA
jgi:hypothetical protein